MKRPEMSIEEQERASCRRLLDHIDAASERVVMWIDAFGVDESTHALEAQSMLRGMRGVVVDAVADLDAGRRECAEMALLAVWCARPVLAAHLDALGIPWGRSL